MLAIMIGPPVKVKEIIFQQKMCTYNLSNTNFPKHELILSTFSFKRHFLKLCQFYFRRPRLLGIIFEFCYSAVVSQILL